MANKTMKTLTINNNTYEVVDSTARSSATEAKTIANEAKSLANDARSAATTATQAANNMSSDVSTAKSDIATLKTNVSNINTKIGDLNSLNTTAKNNLVAAINEAMTKGGSGEGGGGGGLTEVTWEDIKNKPFGDATPIVWEVDPNAEKVDAAGEPMVRVADAPESADILCYGTLITNTGESIPIYPEIISDFTSATMPDGYAFVIDYGVMLNAPGLYIILNTDDSLAVMICMQDVNATDIGLTASAGLYANPTNITQIQGAKITKIPSVFLPPMDDGAGAYVVDLTTMVDTNDTPIVLSNGASFTTRDTFAQGLVSAAQKGKPVMIITKADVTGEKRLYLTGSVLIDDATGYMSLSGVFANMADTEAAITQVYKYHLIFVSYLGYGSIVMSIITDISEGLISPAANIKYIDFGSNEPDMSGIDFSTYNTGDLILALVDVT